VEWKHGYDADIEMVVSMEGPGNLANLAVVISANPQIGWLELNGLATKLYKCPTHRLVPFGV
jgi:hypothetical protein